MKWYYYTPEGSELGPITAAQLRENAATGLIGSDDLVRSEKMTEPVRAERIKGLFSPVTATNDPTPDDVVDARQDSPLPPPLPQPQLAPTPALAPRLSRSVREAATTVGNMTKLKALQFAKDNGLVEDLIGIDIRQNKDGENSAVEEKTSRGEQVTPPPCDIDDAIPVSSDQSRSTSNTPTLNSSKIVPPPVCAPNLQAKAKKLLLANIGPPPLPVKKVNRSPMQKECSSDTSANQTLFMDRLREYRWSKSVLATLAIIVTSGLIVACTFVLFPGDSEISNSSTDEFVSDKDENALGRRSIGRTRSLTEREDASDQGDAKPTLQPADDLDHDSKVRHKQSQGEFVHEDKDNNAVVTRFVNNLQQAPRLTWQQVDDRRSRVKLRVLSRNPGDLPSLTEKVITAVVAKELRKQGITVDDPMAKPTSEDIVVVTATSKHYQITSDSPYARKIGVHALHVKVHLIRRGFVVMDEKFHPVMGILACSHGSRLSESLSASEMTNCIAEAVRDLKHENSRPEQMKNASWQPFPSRHRKSAGSSQLDLLMRKREELMQKRAGLVSKNSYHRSCILHEVAKLADIGGSNHLLSGTNLDAYRVLQKAPLWALPVVNVTGNPMAGKPQIHFAGTYIPKFGIGDYNVLGELFGVNDDWANRQWRAMLGRRGIQLNTGPSLGYSLSLSEEAKLDNYRLWMLISDVRLTHQNVLFGDSIKGTFYRTPAYIFAQQAVSKIVALGSSADTRLKTPKQGIASNRGLYPDVSETVRRDALTTANRLKSNWLWSGVEATDRDVEVELLATASDERHKRISTRAAGIKRYLMSRELVDVPGKVTTQYAFQVAQLLDHSLIRAKINTHFWKDGPDGSLFLMYQLRSTATGDYCDETTKRHIFKTMHEVEEISPLVYYAHDHLFADSPSKKSPKYTKEYAGRLSTLRPPVHGQLRYEKIDNAFEILWNGIHFTQDDKIRSKIMRILRENRDLLENTPMVIAHYHDDESPGGDVRYYWHKKRPTNIDLILAEYPQAIPILRYFRADPVSGAPFTLKEADQFKVDSLSTQPAEESKDRAPTEKRRSRGQRGRGARGSRP